MNKKQETLREIPQVEKILQTQEVGRFIPLIGHNIVVNIIRRETDLFREKFKKDENLKIDDLIGSIIKSCVEKKQEKLQRVINGTGVIIHTNLGRSPISPDILAGLNDSISGYCNLEYHIPTKKRGKRGGMAEKLICELTSAEDALIVNNNASSVFLILNQFAKGKDVIVSRGELIQIGGGFRIPDIMKQSGANLIEVGTTNITELDDYKKAITENTSMILSVHQSNYKIEGFTKSPSLKELSTLKNDSVLFVRDLGSGNMVYDSRLPQPFEPVISSELAQGIDIICFSGDKLLGGCQAGIIAGKKELIAKLKKNPLMRMLRVDKITYYILQETLIHYANGNLDQIALWNIIFQEKKSISNKINKLMRQIKNLQKNDAIKKINTRSTFGGGSLPTVEIDSKGIQINIPGFSPDKIYSMFTSHDVPIVGSIIDDKFTLDFMAIFERDIPLIASAIETLFNDKGK